MQPSRLEETKLELNCAILKLLAHSFIECHGSKDFPFFFFRDKDCKFVSKILGGGMGGATQHLKLHFIFVASTVLSFLSNIFLLPIIILLCSFSLYIYVDCN